MLIFLDESGTDHHDAPYEVLAGLAVRERDLWNMIQAIQLAEDDHFGLRLRDIGIEPKGKQLLKRKVFRLAAQGPPIPPEQRKLLAHDFLEKGDREERTGVKQSFRRDEFTAYGQSAIAFVQRAFELASQYRVTTFAAMVEPTAPQPASDFLRRDYAFLFERVFGFLQAKGTPEEMGIMVFDELERTSCRLLIDRMARYFRETYRGRVRSSRILPEPFFVHSDLTTAVGLADLFAYALNWGFRLARMTKPLRQELRSMADVARSLQYVGSTTDPLGNEWPQYGIFYLDDLRPRVEREAETAAEQAARPYQMPLAAGVDEETPGEPEGH